MIDLTDVTRVEVIDGYGRSYVSHNADDVIIALQDEGQTLKIMHTGDTRHSTVDTHAQEPTRRPVSEGRGILGKDWLGDETVEEYMHRTRGGA